MRWKIEVFHEVLKSGSKAEESRLRTADRLANLMAVFCILSWRVFLLTVLNRAAPDAAPTMALANAGIELLDKLVCRCRQPTMPARNAIFLIDEARPPRRISRTRKPSSTRNRGHVESVVKTHGHRNWRRYLGSRKCR